MNADVCKRVSFLVERTELENLPPYPVLLVEISVFDHFHACNVLFMLQNYFVIVKPSACSVVGLLVISWIPILQNRNTFVHNLTKTLDFVFFGFLVADVYVYVMYMYLVNKLSLSDDAECWASFVAVFYCHIGEMLLPVPYPV